MVDNSCGLSAAECLVQRDQVAELLSRIKADNDYDNPKVTYIEYYYFRNSMLRGFL